MPHHNEEDKVMHIFERRKQKMDPKDAFNATPFLIIIALCIGALIASIVIGYIYHRSDLAKISSLNEKFGFMERKADLLQGKLDHTDTINSYRDNLKLTGLKINGSDNTLTISGWVHNAGHWRVGDIGITVYFLDDEDKIIGRESFTSKPSEGLPLTMNRKRKFVFTVSDPPDSAKETSVVITDMAFKQ
jgi:hypothetical protein